MNDMELASRLIEARGTRTQRQIADAAGVSTSNLSRWESGTAISAIDLSKVCRGLGVSLDKILIDESFEPPAEQKLWEESVIARIRFLYDQMGPDAPIHETIDQSLRTMFFAWFGVVRAVKPNATKWLSDIFGRWVVMNPNVSPKQMLHDAQIKVGFIYKDFNKTMNKLTKGK